MITPSQKEALKKELGNNYASDVLAILNRDNLLNKRGKEYSLTSIRRVFNGYDDNLDVELAIYKYRDEIRAKKEALEKARQTTAK